MPEPVLRTERLVLHPLTAALALTLLEGRPAASSPAASSPADLRPADLHPAEGFPREDDRTVLAGVVASGLHARGTWVVARDCRVLGTAGAAGPVSADGDQEIGYGLVRVARGQGIGTEAVGAVSAVLERREGVRRLTAEVLPGNAASLRLLDRLGFVPVRGGVPPHVRLARAAPGSPAVSRAFTGRHVC